MVYQGRRFRCEARLAGKIYGLPFGIDAGFGDVLTVEPEIIEGSHFLEFVGIQPMQLRVYPRVAHVAEKLHAYTLPRAKENSRVKDLPDLTLLAQTGTFDGGELRHAVERTFDFRKTHRLPDRLPSPPSSWTSIYARMAREDALHWPTLDALERAARAFLDPMLAGERGTWDAVAWKWSAKRAL
jgi:hypothetical protein